VQLQIPPTLAEDRFYWPDWSYALAMEHLDATLPHALALELGETIDDVLAVHGHELTYYFQEHSVAHVAAPIRYVLQGCDGDGDGD